MSWYVKDKGGAWAYTLQEPVSFSAPELGLDGLSVRALAGVAIARCHHGMVTLLPGYSWDGCSLIGRVIETAGTLMASLLHDFLYQLGEQEFFTAPYTRKQADRAFLRYLPCWAKGAWYAGVRLFGGIFWSKKRRDLKVIKK